MTPHRFASGPVGIGLLALLSAGLSLAGDPAALPPGAGSPPRDSAEAKAMPRDTLELPRSRSRAAAASVPGVQILSLEDLRRHENLADALKAVPGFRVRSQSGLGGYSEAWFRGSDGRHLAVYLDGVPLNSSLEPSVDFGKLPVLMIREMTVDKGGLSAEDGPEGASASIRLSTFPSGGAPLSLTGRLSSFGGQETALAAKAGTGDAALYASAGLQAARNDYPFPTDNGTAFVREDDFIREIRNNAYAGRWLNLSWRSLGEGGRLRSLSLRYDAHRKEYPGLYTDLSRAYTEREEIRLHGAWRDSLPFGALTGFSAALEAGWQADAFRDPAQSLGYDSYSLERDGRRFAAQAAVSASLPAGIRARIGSRAGFESADSREPGGFRAYPPPDAARAFVEPSLALSLPLPRGLSARAEAVLVRERLESEDVSGLARDRAPAPFTRDGGSETFRLGLAWTAPRHAGPWRGALAELEAVGRLPALYELLGDNNGVHKNMDLGAQRSLGASLEGSASLGPFALTAGPFWQVLRDPIRLAPRGSGNFLHFVNGADSRIFGFELRLVAEGARWRLSDALTASRPEILAGPAAGNLPAYASAVQNQAEASLALLPPLWADVDLEFRSPYYPDDLALGGTRRPAESLWGAGLRYRKRRLQAALRADNLADRHYRDFAYSPKSGRRYSFRLSINP
jgi:hypothetical protein